MAATSAVRVFRSAVELPDAARALMAAHTNTLQSVQSGPAWYDNIERTVFSAEIGLRYVTLWKGDRVDAVVPLIVAGPAWNANARALGNYYTCLFEPALSDKIRTPELAQVFQGLRKLSPGIGSLTLAPLDPGVPSFKMLEEALSLAGWRPMRYFCFGNWYLDSPDSWQLYLAAREGMLRSTIKRMTQRVSAGGGKVEILTQPEDVERGIAAYNAVYATSWKVPEPSPEFMPGLIRLCAEQGAMRLGVVWLEGRPIAAQLWIVCGRRAEIYKLAYDENHKNLSPGTVLTARLMEHVLTTDGVTEVDYLIGDDPYKKSWMSHRRERWGLIAFNTHSAVGLARLAAESTKRTAKAALARIRSTPKPSRLACNASPSIGSPGAPSS